MIEPRTLTASRLRFGYGPGPAVVDDVDLVCPPGSVTAVTGRSGSGKSTLLHLLGLMLVPDGGEVLLGGRPVHRLPDAERSALRAHHFGFVFQDAALDPTRRVLDAVTETALYQGLDPRRSRARARELMDLLGVDVPAGRVPGQVSGGQAQRVALCRALLGEPSVLLADEPTGNLDPATTDVVLGALTAHARAGGTVVVVTHDPEVERRCDRRFRL
ncbi:ABC transporter ATP-binding protein [Cellulomonas triticagri]|uniref:ATP-binding cassette domain-containing protein n=1 Tax=Cellulomonas triticagri TaxID=2483352 RepID=A0A3M2JML4_9CELL|nr:ATP-binding cassette domain-containing protein [Cellulomonas triticagri]RMI13521.1 ATP-binding cassette domain-containing protein [Cellulomonas triticagri]